MKRQQQLDQLQYENHFDVVILGGGINGACLYDNLCNKGYKVLLVDNNDFASGTSQASGMMIWGGLLYLKNFDVSTVLTLSHDRDHLIQNKADWLSPQMMRYLSSPSGRSKWWVHAGLWLYWLMGRGQRRPPRSENDFGELALIKSKLVRGSLTYEEAFLDQSDTRFVYRWIAPHKRRLGQLALNYCDTEGSYHDLDKRWHLNISDKINGKEYSIESAVVINCTGIWTDQVNADFKIDSPFRHAFSKGVYLGLRREELHQSSLFFDLGKHDDVITYVPWGPISLSVS